MYIHPPLLMSGLASISIPFVLCQGSLFDKSGMVTVGFGNHNAKVGKFYTTGPINDTMAYSLSGNFNKRDGHSRNPVTANGTNDRDGRMRFDETECSSGSSKKQIALWIKTHIEYYPVLIAKDGSTPLSNKYSISRRIVACASLYNHSAYSNSSFH